MSAKPFRLTGASRAVLSARHTSLLNACLMWLKSRRIPAHKMNSGALRTERGCFIRYGFPGCPDIIGILPGGRFLGVEVKTGTGRLTEHQEAFRRTVEESGGVFVVAREIDELAAAVDLAAMERKLEARALTCCGRTSR